MPRLSRHACGPGDPRTRVASGLQNTNEAAILNEEAALVFGNNVHFADHRRTSSYPLPALLPDERGGRPTAVGESGKGRSRRSLQKREQCCCIAIKVGRRMFLDGAAVRRLRRPLERLPTAAAALPKPRPGSSGRPPLLGAGILAGSKPVTGWLPVPRLGRSFSASLLPEHPAGLPHLEMPSKGIGWRGVEPPTARLTV